MPSGHSIRWSITGYEWPGHATVSLEITCFGAASLMAHRCFATRSVGTSRPVRCFTPVLTCSRDLPKMKYHLDTGDEIRRLSVQDGQGSLSGRFPIIFKT